MRTTAKANYAVRAAVELAAASDMVTAEQIAQATGTPHNFLENILGDLRRAGLVESRRGQAGGYLLAKPAAIWWKCDNERRVRMARTAPAATFSTHLGNGKNVVPR
jgi:predicted transcriptional regulator